MSSISKNRRVCHTWVTRGKVRGEDQAWAWEGVRGATWVVFGETDACGQTRPAARRGGAVGGGGEPRLGRTSEVCSRRRLTGRC